MPDCGAPSTSAGAKCGRTPSSSHSKEEEESPLHSILSTTLLLASHLVSSACFALVFAVLLHRGLRPSAPEFHVGRLNFVYETCTHELYRQYGVCSFPTASVVFRTGDGLPTRLGELSAGVPYAVALHLRLLARRGAEARNVQAALRAYDADDSLVTEHKRAVVLRGADDDERDTGGVTAAVYWLFTFALPWHYWPIRSLWQGGESRRPAASRSVSIELADSFYDSPFEPTAKMLVTVEDADLVIESGRLHITGRLSWPEYFAYYWPTATVGAIFAVALLLCGALSASYWAYRATHGAAALADWLHRRKESHAAAVQSGAECEKSAGGGRRALIGRRLLSDSEGTPV